MKLQTVIQSLEQIAPLHFAEEWDQVGLLINPLRPRIIQKIRLTIDLTEAVADEAIADQADLIVAYHPILFRPIHRFNAEEAADRTLMKLIQNDLAVYSPHTALDAILGGVNDWLAEGVGEGEITVLHAREDSDAGQGRRVTLAQPIPFETLTQKMKTYLGLQTVRVATPARECPIHTIAFCAGAGTGAFQGIEADCYITGEMNHHSLLEATQNGASVILCEHSNTERGYLPFFAKILRKSLGDGVDISVSEIDSDPIKFN